MQLRKCAECSLITATTPRMRWLRERWIYLADIKIYFIYINIERLSRRVAIFCWHTTFAALKSYSVIYASVISCIFRKVRINFVRRVYFQFISYFDFKWRVIFVCSHLRVKGSYRYEVCISLFIRERFQNSHTICVSFQWLRELTYRAPATLIARAVTWFSFR